MHYYEFTATLLGCTVTITVTQRAMREWDQAPSEGAIQIRARAERMAVGVLGSGRAWPGERWNVTILSATEAEGACGSSKRARLHLDADEE